VIGDAAEQLVDGLDDHAALAHEVPRAQDRQGVVGERRRHARTVRSAARARNRPRGRLALLLIAILGALLALTARADTAAGDPAAGDLLAGDSGEPLDGGDPDTVEISGSETLTLDELEVLAPDGLGELGIGGSGDSLQGIAEGIELDALDDEAAESGTVLPLGVEAARRADSADQAMELYDELRRRRPWWWSQLDLTIAWRRTISDAAAKGTSRAGELWVLATWSL
jgi:hypothetical protein